MAVQSYGGKVRAPDFPDGLDRPRWDPVFADSHNNKVKRLDAARRAVTTWLGSGVAGRADGPGTVTAFREPGGVWAGTDGLYIADTNNHRIAIADWASGAVRTLIGD
jgi:hypothetical protein